MFVVTQDIASDNQSWKDKTQYKSELSKYR